MERRSSRRDRFEALQERHLGHFWGDVLMEVNGCKQASVDFVDEWAKGGGCVSQLSMKP